VEDPYAEQKNFREWLQFVVIVVGSIIAIETYTGQKEKDRQEQAGRDKQDKEAREKESRERDRNYRVNFYNARVAVYLELADCCARISVSRDFVQSEPDLRRFGQLFNGKMMTVSDNEVVMAMSRFNDAVNNASRDRGDKTRRELQQLARAVSIACRESLRKEFHFEALTEGQTIFGEGPVPAPAPQR
jgi:hypothetical protein